MINAFGVDAITAAVGNRFAMEKKLVPRERKKFGWDSVESRRRASLNNKMRNTMGDTTDIIREDNRVLRGINRSLGVRERVNGGKTPLMKDYAESRLRKTEAIKKMIESEKVGPRSASVSARTAKSFYMSKEIVVHQRHSIKSNKNENNPKNHMDSLDQKDSTHYKLHEGWETEQQY